jgi:DNA-binding beta-propeller fold protein YncE
VTKFLYKLSYPGNDAQFLDPGNVYFDPRQEEIFVTDTRNWRIVIFDKRGRYTFDFRDQEHLAGAGQVCVDSLGRIYVLRSNPKSVISVFEYNGEYLHELRFTYPETDNALTISGVVLDEQDRFYVLSVMPAHVYSFTTSGEPLSDFAIFAEDTLLQNQPGFGTMALVKGKLVIPVPIEGYVARYTTDGQIVTSLGSPGDGEDQFSLPIAAAGDQDGHVYVLDKHKHSILEFDDSGKWLRIMGGRGMSPGWFYHPTCLAIAGNGQAIVGQTYLARIQAVALTPQEPNADTFTQASDTMK